MIRKSISTIFAVLFLVGISMAQRAGNEKLFKSSHIKKTMKKALDWQLKHPNHELYDWTNGAFYAGVFAAWENIGWHRKTQSGIRWLKLA